MKPLLQNKEHLAIIDWIRQKRRKRILKGKIIHDKGHNHILNDFL